MGDGTDHLAAQGRTGVWSGITINENTGSSQTGSAISESRKNRERKTPGGQRFFVLEMSLNG